LMKVFGLKEIAKESALRGLLIHQFYERRAGIEKDIVAGLTDADIEMIKKRYMEAYFDILDSLFDEKRGWIEKNRLDKGEIRSAIEKSIVYEVELRAKNIFNNMIGTGLSGDRLWKALSPKIWSEQKVVSPRLGLVGVVDLVQESSEEIIPIELKTGSAPEGSAWPNHKLQLSAYMLMLADSRAKDVNRGIIRYVDHDKEFAVLMNPFLREELLKRLDSIGSCLKGRIPKKADNQNKCTVCGLQAVCYDDRKIENLQQLLLKKGGECP